MDIRINGIMNDSIVDGPGLRLAVFVQGCSHRCPGCHNPQTHDPLGGAVRDTGEVIRLMDAGERLSERLGIDVGAMVRADPRLSHPILTLRVEHE